jgi:hypothetical protein
VGWLCSLLRSNIMPSTQGHVDKGIGTKAIDLRAVAFNIAVVNATGARSPYV